MIKFPGPGCWRPGSSQKAGERESSRTRKPQDPVSSLQSDVGLLGLLQPVCQHFCLYEKGANYFGNSEISMCAPLFI